MENTIFRKFFTIILSVFILIYIGYQVYNVNKKTISTESAVYSTMKDSINTDAYVIRDEVIIRNNDGNVVNYLIDDGGKVSNNGKIANVYKDSKDIIIKKQIDQIDKEIEQLKNLNKISNASITNPNAINIQVSDCLKQSISDINDNKLQNIDDDKDSILYLINQRSIITGKVENFNDRIADLQSKRDSLMSSYNKEISSVLSPKSGYFVSITDGLEEAVNYSEVNSLTPDAVRDALSKKEEQRSDSIGKIISGVNWYVTCNVSYDESKDIKIGDYLSITFPFSSISDVPCSVIAINTNSEKTEAAIILECDYMNKELSLLRTESISLNLNSYSGILISKKSLHEDTVVKEIIDENGNTSTE